MVSAFHKNHFNAIELNRNLKLQLNNEQYEVLVELLDDYTFSQLQAMEKELLLALIKLKSTK